MRCVIGFYKWRRKPERLLKDNHALGLLKQRLRHHLALALPHRARLVEPLGHRRPVPVQQHELADELGGRRDAALRQALQGDGAHAGDLVEGGHGVEGGREECGALFRCGVFHLGLVWCGQMVSVGLLSFFCVYFTILHR
jgi:hypothetical protein